MSHHIVASAPGKLILFGEHAVVHGVTAVATALTDLRIIVEIDSMLDTNDDPALSIFLSDLLPIESTINISTYLLIDALKPIEMISIDDSSKVPSDECVRVLNEFVKDLLNIQLHAIDNKEIIIEQCKQCVMSICYMFYSMIYTSYSHVKCEACTKTPSNIANNLNYKVCVRSIGLPVGAGLGSSAAFSVAISSAFFKLYLKLTDQIVDIVHTNRGETSIWSSEIEVPSKDVLEEINKWSFASEVIIHGTPSGLDNTTSCYGGALSYKRPIPIPNVSTNSKITTKNPGNVNTNAAGAPTFTIIPSLPYGLRILVINTKVPRSTKKLVAHVKELLEPNTSTNAVTPVTVFDRNNPHVMSNLYAPIACSMLHAIEEISNAFLLILKQYEHSQLAQNGVYPTQGTGIQEVYCLMKRLVNTNHLLLEALEVTHPSLQKVKNLSNAFEFSCKLTGAGGGGCAFTLLPPPSNIKMTDHASNTIIHNPILDVDKNNLAVEESIVSLKSQLHDMSYDVLESRIGGYGMVWHITDPIL